MRSLTMNLRKEMQDHKKLTKEITRGVINRFVTKADFKKYALDMFVKKDKWSGCFGCLSIIEYDFIDVLNEKTGIVDLLTKMNDNRLRRVAESLFAISCLYVLGEEVFEKAYDGLYYDGINPARNTRIFRAGT